MLVEFDYPDGGSKTWVNPLHVSAVAADVQGNTVISLNNGQVIFVKGAVDAVVAKLKKAV